MELDEISTLERFEIGVIINSKEKIAVTDDLEVANSLYEEYIKKYATSDTINHVIIYIYDYDLATNINYYDNYDN